MAKEKFIDFKDYLLKETRNNFYISFEEIEEIIGQKLCPSAYQYEQYWRASKTHTFPTMINNCGFQIEVDLKNTRVRLYRNN